MKNLKNKPSEPLRFSEPLRKSQRFTLPKKKLRLKASAKEILALLTIEFLTPQQIAQRRKTSLRAVYKVMKKLKEKGLFDNSFNQVNLYRPTEPFSEPLRIRLHAQEWNIQLITSSDKYQKTRQKSNTIYLDGNTVRLYNNSIEIYSGHSYMAEDEHKATAQSLEYWERFFSRLEHEFQIIIKKNRVQNMKLVNHHYAETNSGVAKDAKEHKKQYTIHSDDDGKLWAVTDDSFSLTELETLHPDTAKEDMTKIRKQLNDWRNHDPPTNSQLAVHIQNVTENQLLFAENIQTHIQAIKDLSKGVHELRAEVRNWNNTHTKQ